jgi:CHASE2 domain-containing sensor protein
LAGALWLPRGAARRLPIAFEARAGADRLPSMGAALADAVAPQRDHLAHALGRLLERVSTRELRPELHGPPLILHEVMVNYALLDQMSEQTLLAATPEIVAKNGSRIRGRVVIIGDLTAGPVTDTFPVPGVERDQRGALLHASLANTLLVNPLGEFRHGVRIGIDIALSVLVLLIVHVLGTRKGVALGEKEAHALEGRVILGTVVAVLILGFAFVFLFRVMWLDFVLVTVFFALHPTAQRWTTALLSRVRSRPGAADAH